ncbi:SAM-dependent methyltransferase [Amycolatopsis magusensis]|uniref:SAM-dependent methyltransferase n=1 Tax=Amycolatopsis magusensis TaxID=882444 RepID=UPI0024A7F831|nr:SAM-dependent methyltransferase [Amycolatopsis magusensis]MDI5979172.1 SAM-dependent methyltransferase [Amycolatopsis magusensis]
MDVVETNRIGYAGGAVDVLVDTAGWDASRPQLWPSVGMYPCYDELLYDLMTLDEVRNTAYRTALERTAPGRSALDIGTGRDLNWAIEAVAGGATEVIAVEGMPETYEMARERLADLEWGDRIKLCQGLSTDLNLDRRAELCVSEIIGDIGGAEGAAVVLADARRRLTTPDAVFVPDSCATFAGAVCFDDIFGGDTGFFAESLDLLSQAFTIHNGPFDVLLGVANAGPDALVTDHARLEQLEFNGDLAVTGDTTATLTVRRPGRVDGLLLWIELRCLPGGEPVNSLTMRTNWMPVYLPLFERPRQVRPGDRLDLGFRYAPAEDGVHPDYSVTACLHTADGEAGGEHHVRHRPTDFRAHPVYERLFPAR